MSPLAGCDSLDKYVTCSCEVLKDPPSKEKGGYEDGNYGVGVPDKLSVKLNVVYFLNWRGGFEDFNKAGGAFKDTFKSLSLILRGGCFEAFAGPRHAAAGSRPGRNPANDRKL